MIDHVQAARMQSLWASVVMAVLDESVKDFKDRGAPALESLRRWAESRDGREVLHCAGIEVNSRTTKGLIAFVEKGIMTSKALARD